MLDYKLSETPRPIPNKFETTGDAIDTTTYHSRHDPSAKFEDESSDDFAEFSQGI